MMSPNRPTVRTRLLSNKTIRITILSLVALGATVLMSANSSARLLGQRLIAGAAAIITGSPKADYANRVLTRSRLNSRKRHCKAHRRLRAAVIQQPVCLMDEC